MIKVGRTSLALAIGVALPALTVGPVAAGPVDCDAQGGNKGTGEIPWAQTRLDYDKVHDLATGRGITVAVIDSGIAQPANHDQVATIETRDGVNVLAGVSPDAKYDATDTRDCDGHGTRVASIIAARPLEGIGFVGLAPGVVVVPIKASDEDTADLDSADTMAAAIQHAIDVRSDVINISAVTDVDTDALRGAIARTAREDIVVVAASGNDQTDPNATANYPAAFADEFPNVLTVGAIGTDDMVTQTSTSGSVGVVAPGASILAPNPVQDAYAYQDGTSFAAPFVAATAALVRERFPRLSAEEVVNRIEATADRPGVTVPDPSYGYGVVNPYLALTAVRDDTRVVPEERPPVPVAAPDLPPPPDRTLQNIAYGAAAGLLGIAIIAVIGKLAWRRTAAERGRKSARA